MKLTLKNLLALSSAIVLVAFALAMFIVGQQTKTAFGSTSRGSEYQGTTTDSTSASATVSRRLCSSNATIGSIVVTQPGTAGYVRIWDATTTSTTTIQSNQVSSTSPSLTLGMGLQRITGASDVGGTYTFDQSTYAGLVIETSTGFDGEYAIEYRCN